MTNVDIYEQLTSVFRHVFAREDLVLRPEMYSADIASWDSFRNFELMLAIEDRFNVEFIVEDLAAMKNIGDIVAMLAARKE